ncbi:hypothetical protein HMP06_2566 [Sphingomonas sp. HMP6]|nr:hypothetical protein HMP06_2566 [Sphingomonas sp. HMP6]
MRWVHYWVSVFEWRSALARRLDPLVTRGSLQGLISNYRFKANSPSAKIVTTNTGFAVQANWEGLMSTSWSCCS